MIYKMIFMSVLLFFSGCASKILQEKDPLAKPVGLAPTYKNYFTKDVFEIFTSPQTEDVMVYLPKNTMTIRVMMSITNIEDILYMKLVDDGDFAIDKVLRRVDDIKKLGVQQDGYMFEPSILKDKVVLQIYVPAVYVYKNLYKPTLVYSYKRDGRSIQDKIHFYFIKERLADDINKSSEKPVYLDVKEYCKNHQIEPQFKLQIDQINRNRVDSEFLGELKKLCK
ncbi:hypothetical protein MNB_SM-3-6 [hydrothermal vent metagenome]|uniref:Lipoprotein n=1 Tax=hydrothermal vent metagenome TaxID=652676 RepID=A0A1W1D3W7_9ZZZZ